MTPLEPGFEPTQFDVICARGRTAYNHEGNQRFRGVLERNLAKYQSATTKQQKTIVVNALLDEIKEESRFVRKLPDGKWVQVPEHVAKEKIGQGFRDLLHTQYRSSTKSKVKLRRERRKRQKQEQQGSATDSAAGLSEVESGRGQHRPSNSTDTFEPLPLDDSTASTDTLIYDCPPFAFGSKEEETKTKEGEDESMDAKPAATEGAERKSSEPSGEEQAAPQQAQSTVEGGSSFATFVSPASPESSRQQPRYHQAPGPPPDRPTTAHYPSSWERYQREGSHYPPPPPPPHYSPPDYRDYHPHHYYSPTYSPPPPDYRSHHGSALPPPPPQPQYYPPSHHQPRSASPHAGGPGGWTPYHPSQAGYQSGYYGSPHPSWSYHDYHSTRGYSYWPSPQDYYNPSSPPQRTHDEYARHGSGHAYNPYPPPSERRPQDYSRADYPRGGDHRYPANAPEPRPAYHPRGGDLAAGGSAPEAGYHQGPPDARPPEHMGREESGNRQDPHPTGGRPPDSRVADDDRRGNDQDIYRQRSLRSEDRGSHGAPG